MNSGERTKCLYSIYEYTYTYRHICAYMIVYTVHVLHTALLLINSNSKLSAYCVNSNIIHTWAKYLNDDVFFTPFCCCCFKYRDFVLLFFLLFISLFKIECALRYVLKVDLYILSHSFSLSPKISYESIDGSLYFFYSISLHS